MKKSRRSLFLGVIGVLVVLGLLAGCYRPAAPDVTPTPAGGGQAAPSTQDQLSTAAANSTQAARSVAGTATATATISPVTPTPTSVPATSVPPTSPAPTPTATPSPTGRVTHTVQRGENLFRIALRYGTTVQAIASASGIVNPALIYVGQVLQIPSSSGGQPPQPPAGETTYVVQPGDNLFRIALRYNLSYTYLAQYNGIANPARISVGQVLRIPPR